MPHDGEWAATTKGEATAARIRAVALDQFSQLGYERVTMGGIAKAALTRHLNAGNRAAAAAAFMGWLKPAAIRSRREAERDLFAKGRYPTGTIPVWAIDRNGRVDFSRPIRRLTEAEALALVRPPLNPPSITISPDPSTAPADPAAAAPPAPRRRTTR